MKKVNHCLKEKTDHSDKQLIGEKENDQIVAEKKHHCCSGENQGLYKKPWFWVCVTLIVFCITRPFVIVICGNNSDNTDCGSSNRVDGI